MSVPVFQISGRMKDRHRGCISQEEEIPKKLLKLSNYNVLLTCIHILYALALCQKNMTSVTNWVEAWYLTFHKYGRNDLR